MKRALIAVLLVLAVFAPSSASAAAAPRKLELSYLADAGYAAAVTLTCGPPGGAHPKAAQACTALKKVGGKPAKLKPVKRVCTLEYAPITAQITGTWKGRTVAWSQRYPNRCDMLRSTGVLFDF